jgi:hypothetical protein
MAQIFWMTPEGVYVNETSAGGVQWMTPEGVYVNEQPAAAGGSTGILRHPGMSGISRGGFPGHPGYSGGTV